jgi:hypothetical protein
MEVICSSETPVDFQRTIWGYIPEDRTLHNLRCENLKSYNYLQQSVGTQITIPEVSLNKQDFSWVILPSGGIT